ncbi:MBL fold metallo-hydrolase [uncultured Parasphingorhabdus sp.]|uniref:MBL fold metallo-hydrolase n=1 Tax=uncultured Parasphingorhabdus sp. TaxID=2709694 RepID=UPI002AA77918|nr:MBL fold metallo-hydrolase [uncultured Parasphingorhabdus sp.]
MKKLGLGLMLLVLFGIGAALLFQEQIGERLFAGAVETAVTRDVIGDLPDGLHVALCGSGSPLPDPTRAGPCSAVIIDGKLFIVDIGGGAVRNLGLMGLNPGATEALLLTHFHSDHIDGMGELMLQRWAGGGRDAPLPVIAPEGVDAIVDGLNAAYAADVQYRIAHHGEATMPASGAGGAARPFTFPEGQEQMVVYDKHGIRITAFSVAHKPIVPAVGYRFDYKGRSVVFSGDTVKLPVVANICNGCDLLVHEVLNAKMVGTLETAFEKAGRKRLVKIMADIPDYHTTPVEAAETAKDGKAKMLVFSHIVPALPLGYLDAYFMKGANAAYDGPIVLGKDGRLFSLPANKDSIEQGSLL